jgi:hypothetical protein
MESILAMKPVCNAILELETVPQSLVKKTLLVICSTQNVQMDFAGPVSWIMIADFTQRLSH